MIHKVTPAKNLSGADIGCLVSGDVYVRGPMTGRVEGYLVAVYHSPSGVKIELRQKNTSSDDLGWEFNIPEGAEFAIHEKEETP